MHKHHPDVLSENSDTDMARKLNEAFELIKREGLSSIIKVVDWGISENAGAYCKRKLLHLLIQEFIDPFECIRLLCPYEEKEDSEMQIFRIKCRVNYPNLRFA